MEAVKRVITTHTIYGSVYFTETLTASSGVLINNTSSETYKGYDRFAAQVVNAPVFDPSEKVTAGQQRVINVFKAGHSPTYSTAKSHVFNTVKGENGNEYLLSKKSVITFIENTMELSLGALMRCADFNSPSAFIKSQVDKPRLWYNGDSTIKEYYNLCGGSIISPAPSSKKLLDFIGINQNFFNRLDAYGLGSGVAKLASDTQIAIKNICAHSPRYMQLITIGLSLQAAISVSRNVVFIVDSEEEEYTNHIFGEKFLVSDSIENEKTSNAIRIRVGDAHDMLEHVMKKLNEKQKLEKNVKAWENFKLVLTGSDQTLRSLLKTGTP